MRLLYLSNVALMMSGLYGLVDTGDSGGKVCWMARGVHRHSGERRRVKVKVRSKFTRRLNSADLRFTTPH